MKQKLLILFILCAVLLTGCFCKHEWKDATCEDPQICALCEKTEGEALGHLWTEADCLNPKTCTACGKTEGEALGHNWQDATCEAPKTCSVCNAVEGEALGHAFGEWTEIDTETEEHICTVCGYTEQQAIDRVRNLLEILTGSWDTSAWYLNGVSYTVEELQAIGLTPADYQFRLNVPGDGSCNLIAPDGSVQSITVAADLGVEYEVDEEGIELYHFQFLGNNGQTAALGMLSANLSKQEQYNLWMILSGDTAIIFSVSDPSQW